MRILYAIQGTGNGHITRARVMAPALQRAGIQTDYLFSGRHPDAYFDMECFGEYQTRTGLTLVTHAGRVSKWQTLRSSRLGEFCRDVRRLDLSAYELVLTDFEPVAAWAAWRQKRRCIGLAHQYALCFPLPGTEKTPFLKQAVSLFAPADIRLGIHWQAFDAPILPPMILPQTYPLHHDASTILVYLPFEERGEVQQWLQQFPDYHFRIYLKTEAPSCEENLTFLPLSREGFQQDLARCGGVICNAGFGLCSEAMQSGKKLLVKPLKGQIEQFSNAVILQQMQRASIISSFDADLTASWLEQAGADLMRLPDVAGSVAHWLKEGAVGAPEVLARQLWQVAE
ncbi:MJ1255/VC2487 family glycosyltransferase [Nitrincola alkalilacustris]|uniref:MJ1255/VC2487 family glycosyltransferase n=1 Tax=Nitrincola alkalilacustris TaxID=1571224 RepID=UPI00124C000D|nr:MJ1255/VC2487 family glycosyltransferase [Nitrincola alkalilacustris]